MENCFRPKRWSDRSLVDSNLWHNKLIRTVSRFRYDTMHWILIFSSIEFAKYKFTWAILLRKSTLTFLNYRFNATWMQILKKKCAKATSTEFALFRYYTNCTSRVHLHNFECRGNIEIKSSLFFILNLLLSTYHHYE